MLRQTKIVATLGPSSSHPKILRSMMITGVDVIRINFSHADTSALELIALVRQISTELNHPLAVMADLQGPKIRIACFEASPINLVKDATFILDVNYDKKKGNSEIVGVDYEALNEDVKQDDFLLLDDGRIVLQVTKIEGGKIYTRVINGGNLSNNKGINRLGGGLSAKALTEKDREDLKIALDLGADYIAISFPRTVADIEEAKELIKSHGGVAGIIAKIERAEAIEVLDEIIQVSDAIMVARGDLGVEIGDAELPQIQKHIIQRCRALNKPVITATQMMESMIENAIPTRAEVFDVANAVIDGTDAVMLSAETASGVDPANVVTAMDRICKGAERNRITYVSGHRMECRFKDVEEAIAMSAMYAANHFSVAGIIALTESGNTPLLMSRIRSGIPIFAFTRHLSTQRRMALYRGVYPINCAAEFGQVIEDDNFAVQLLRTQGHVQAKDYVLITHGDLAGKAGQTNTLHILEVLCG